ncbi:MAG: hypothetical protein VR68_00155 [Peptococcaceae bacterium BRH_c4a]|nr:MAG: hypothetical protein VR68_00155 [Peptococcaceae bacterium BRH_c4a]
MELSIIKMDVGSLPVLLDKQMRIVRPVFEFLKFQKLREKADNTLRAYGWDMKTFFEFLDRYGYSYDETIGEATAPMVTAAFSTTVPTLLQR